MNKQFDYGMVGLGTMGRNLAYNMAENEFSVVGYDKDATQVESFINQAPQEKISATANLQQFIEALSTPRKIILLVPAGKIVDVVIEELQPLLTPGDLILDFGNSYYKDTNRRYEELRNNGLHFMGVGISGGEQGARTGPSIMPGGDKDIYKSMAPMLDAIAAKVGNDACVGWLGNGAAGHYVKMVHNGIEYALMQLLAETYHILKRTAGLSNGELQQVFQKWNEGPLQSFLVEITANIFKYKDELTAAQLIDVILDTAKQKGTGAWTSEDGMALGIPIPAIDAAVTARLLSSRKNERIETAGVLSGIEHKRSESRDEIIQACEQALHFAMITTFAQGMALLQHASTAYSFNLNLSQVARIWRGGCIIRAALLEKIQQAYEQQTPNLLVSPLLINDLLATQKGIRKVIGLAVQAGIPVPCYSASLNYYDAYRSEWLPANLTQAQRDYFGAHKYERTDREGIFHTDWTA